MMQNYVRTKQTVTEEELRKVKEMDWDSYYRESLPTEMQGISNCPSCNAIILARDDASAQTCYRCGCAIGADKATGK